MAGTEIQVTGLRELNRSLRKLERSAAKSVRDELKSAGEPVRREAESMALGHIRRMTVDWSQMKLGMTSKDVYIAPRRRRRRGTGRPNLAILLMERAMKPAAELHRQEVVQQLSRAMDRLISRSGF